MTQGDNQRQAHTPKPTGVGVSSLIPLPGELKRAGLVFDKIAIPIANRRVIFLLCGQTPRQIPG
jgi:hypothetical protein